MSAPENKKLRPSRRGFLAAAGGLVAAAGTGLAVAAPLPEKRGMAPAHEDNRSLVEPFWGAHQSGITTPSQRHTYFAAFDLTTAKRDDVVKTLKVWTEGAARMTDGKPAVAADYDAGASDGAVTGDSGDVLELKPSRLTITFGFGAGLFTKDGHDRYGLAAQRPEALIDLPRFNGDQLAPARTGGDLSVQACADDPQVAFHAVRQLARLTYGAAEIRWAQSGFSSDPGGGKTTRNLMGFKDGTQRPDALDQVALLGSDQPAWLRGGSYLVVRRIRVALEHWDRMKLGFQEQTMGRHKLSGAPLGLKHERDDLALERTDKDGNVVIPDNAHVRLANAVSNDGAQVLRRGYSYNDGVNFTAERWPPWRQGMEYDAGLLFICYQRDPRTGFVKIFETMAKRDMLNQFATHVGGGLFVCPGGARKGEFIGAALLEKT